MQKRRNHANKPKPLNRHRIELQGWTNATLTPNKNEFNRIAAAVNVEVDSSKPAASLKKVCVIKLDSHPQSPYDT
jgi:hypothetical protein